MNSISPRLTPQKSTNVRAKSLALKATRTGFMIRKKPRALACAEARGSSLELSRLGVVAAERRGSRPQLFAAHGVNCT